MTRLIGIVLGWLAIGPGVDLIAHRGESADAPENTMAAFRLAWERKVPAIELDVHLTRDGALIVSHDANTKRTTGTPRRDHDEQSLVAEDAARCGRTDQAGRGQGSLAPARLVRRQHRRARSGFTGRSAHLRVSSQRSSRLWCQPTSGRQCVAAANRVMSARESLGPRGAVSGGLTSTVTSRPLRWMR